eukprot:352327-Chlamydomonas_euryale.AAC.5
MPASCAMRSSSRVSVGGGYFWRPASCAMRSSTPSPVDSMPSAFRVAASTPCNPGGHAESRELWLKHSS